MPCIREDGTLSRSGELILLACRNPATPDKVARETGLPLFRIRSAIRELTEVECLEQLEEGYRTTEKGIKLLEGMD
ncbi:MAG: hypothetical protein ACLFUU_11185 [Desulfobacteraceae bacterium]